MKTHAVSSLRHSSSFFSDAAAMRFFSDAASMHAPKDAVAEFRVHV
jgi:hypothetical protein